MRYRFLAKWHRHYKCDTVNLIYGGSAVVRQDALKLLNKIIYQTFKWTYFRKVVPYHCSLREVVDEPERLSYKSEFNVFYIRWENGVIDTKQAGVFFRACGGVGTRRHVIIMGEVPRDVAEVFDKVYPKGSRGKSFQCVMSTDEKALLNYVKNRLDVFGMEATDEVKKLLLTLPTTSMINVFNILSYLKEDERNIDDMLKMRLFRDSLELEVSGTLIEKGKNAVLKHPGLDDLNAKMFFGAVQMRLTRILLIKSSAESYGTQRDKLKLPPDVFRQYWKFSEKFDSRVLLERLRLVLMLRRYARYQHAVLILLNHW